MKLSKEEIMMFDDEIEFSDGFFDYLHFESYNGLHFVYFGYNPRDGFFIEYREDIEPESEENFEWDHKQKYIKPETLRRKNKEDYKEFLKFKTYVENQLTKKAV